MFAQINLAKVLIKPKEFGVYICLIILNVFLSVLGHVVGSRNLSQHFLLDEV